jgi:hypothetical protein
MSKYTNTYVYRHYKFFQQGKETFEYISACLPSKIYKIFVFLYIFMFTVGLFNYA